MDKQLAHYFELLGRIAKDRVTHFEGTVTNLTFDLYGCIQAAIQPKVDKDNKFPDGRWLDVHRLEPCGETRTMSVPVFSPDTPSIAILGRWGRDPVTNFEGTISSIAFLLSGKAEVTLSPRIDKDGKLPEGKWFDAKRVALIGDQRSMMAPKFEQIQVPVIIPEHPRDHQHGPAEKPPVDQGPRI